MSSVIMSSMMMIGAINNIKDTYMTINALAMVEKGIFHGPTLELMKHTEKQCYDFPKKISLNEIDISYHDFMTQKILEEKVERIERHCEGLAGLPTGIVSLFTIPIYGTAVRHEYIFVETTNYFIIIEVQKSEVSKYFFKIQAWEKNDDSKQIIKLSKRGYSERCLEQLVGKDLLNNLIVQQIIHFFCFQQLMMNTLGYNLISSNCKVLARALLYFCKQQIDSEKILEAMLGLFDDAIFAQNEKLNYKQQIQWKTARSLSKETDENCGEMLFLIKLLRNQVPLDLPNKNRGGIFSTKPWWQFNHKPPTPPLPYKARSKSIKQEQYKDQEQYSYQKQHQLSTQFEFQWPEYLQWTEYLQWPEYFQELYKKKQQEKLAF